MNLTPEIIEATITGLIIGLGMVVYRVYQHHSKDDIEPSQSTQTESNGNGFRVAMESVREAYGTNVELLHTQLYELEKELTEKEAAIERLQNILLAKGVMVDETGQVFTSASNEIEAKGKDDKDKS